MTIKINNGGGFLPGLNLLSGDKSNHKLISCFYTRLCAERNLKI